MLTLRSDCSLVTLKPAHSPFYLPPLPSNCQVKFPTFLALLPLVLMDSYWLVGVGKDDQDLRKEINQLGINVANLHLLGAADKG